MPNFETGNLYESSNKKQENPYADDFKNSEGIKGELNPENFTLDYERLVQEIARKELVQLAPEINETRKNNKEREGGMMQVIARITKSKLAKVAALLATMTIVAGAPAKAEARGGYGYKISDSLERGAGRAVEDIFRGMGRGMEEGLEEGIKKTILNLFGIRTRDQMREMERMEK